MPRCSQQTVGAGGQGHLARLLRLSRDVTLLRNTSENPPQSRTPRFTGRREPGPGNLSAMTTWRTDIPVWASVSTSPTCAHILRAYSDSDLRAGTKVPSEGKQHVSAAVMGRQAKGSRRISERPRDDLPRQPDSWSLGHSFQSAGEVSGERQHILGSVGSALGTKMDP